jgi:threonine/homoserine efflux transporter RhtA
MVVLSLGMAQTIEWLGSICSSQISSSRKLDFIFNFEIFIDNLILGNFKTSCKVFKNEKLPQKVA